jgi:hypothetical protein
VPYSSQSAWTEAENTTCGTKNSQTPMHIAKQRSTIPELPARCAERCGGDIIGECETRTARMNLKVSWLELTATASQFAP